MILASELIGRAAFLQEHQCQESSSSTLSKPCLTPARLSRTLSECSERKACCANGSRNFFFIPEVATIAGPYLDFSTIAGAALVMTAASRKVMLSSNDKEQILEAMLSLPPHQDVHEALALLRDAGLRLVTLTNSNQRGMEEQLKNAGIETYFERTFSVDSVRKFKPAPETYQMVAKELDLTTSDLRMVAAHAWDIIGAMRAGCAAAFVARPGKVLNPLLDKPDVVGPDLLAVAEQIIAREAKA